MAKISCFCFLLILITDFGGHSAKKARRSILAKTWSAYLLKMEIEPTPEVLQRKLYFLLEQLQNMAKELPSKYQMRVPIELLSGLANCLLNDTVFQIVKGLMEIQHVTEIHLFQQRQQIINKHALEVQSVINTTPDDQLEFEKAILQERHKKELQQTDMKLVLQLDQKVSDQQSTLEQAGVPGFFVTKKPLEIKVQMYLLDFILRLSSMDIP